MSENDLRDYMLQRTAEIQAEYERITKRSGEDAGTAGDNGEENWKETLEKWLPPMYRVVTKGRIMNIKGECSPQIDVLVLSPWYPDHLLHKKEYLEGGVIAAFECKLNLRVGDIKEAVKNSVALRRNSQSQRTGTPYKEANHHIIYGLLAQSHNWKREGSKPLDNITKNLYKQEQEFVKHPREFLDVVCVADLATWETTKMFLPPQVLMHEESRKALEDRYGSNSSFPEGLLEAGHVEYSEYVKDTSSDTRRATPLGRLLVYLFKRIAYEDKGLRPLAEYFILANLSGSGSGTLQQWPLEKIFSDELRNNIKNDFRVSQSRWDEWGTNLS